VAIDAAQAVVFLGPTLPESECRSILAADVRPPARRGDVYRAIADGFDTIVLIDGEFHGSPAVWQREIVDAMAEGLRVHGASSMGALRAAELHTFGMVGHGRIFEWFRDGLLVADDEVALTYAVTTAGYHPTSEPLVNIRATLAKAVPDVLTAAECEQVVAQARATYFADRSFDALFAAAPVTQWSAGRRDAFERFITANRIDQKRLDAIAALRAVASMSTSARGGAVIPPAPSLFWKRERVTTDGQAVSPAMSVDKLRALRRAASMRFFLAEWARSTSSPLSNADLPEDVIWGRILEWAAANGIDHPELTGSDLAEWIVEAGPDGFGYIWYADAEIALSLKAEGVRSGAERDS